MKFTLSPEAWQALATDSIRPDVATTPLSRDTDLDLAVEDRDSDVTSDNYHRGIVANTQSKQVMR